LAVENLIRISEYRLNKLFTTGNSNPGMKRDVTGSILLGTGVISSVISKTGSTEYNLAIYDQALVYGLILSGITLLALALKQEYTAE
jgi:hypothetical protein